MTHVLSTKADYVRIRVPDDSLCCRRSSGRPCFMQVLWLGGAMPKRGHNLDLAHWPLTQQDPLITSVSDRCNKDHCPGWSCLRAPHSLPSLALEGCCTELPRPRAGPIRPAVYHHEPSAAGVVAGFQQREAGCLDGASGLPRGSPHRWP